MCTNIHTKHVHTKVRKRSQSAGPGKFDKKIGKEESFDQVGSCAVK